MSKDMELGESGTGLFLDIIICTVAIDKSSLCAYVFRMPHACIQDQTKFVNKTPKFLLTTHAVHKTRLNERELVGSNVEGIDIGGKTGVSLLGSVRAAAAVSASLSMVTSYRVFWPHTGSGC